MFGFKLTVNIMTENKRDVSEQRQRPIGGVFITKGMTVGIPAGGLTIGVDEEGKLSADPVNLHVHFDVCPSWLDLAFKHVLESEERNAEVIAAWKTPDDERLSGALEAEFEAGMQAMMSGAIAIDAFYASVKEKISLPKDLTKIWREKKTARHIQIAEVMRRAFLMDEKSFHQFRDSLKGIMRLRDMAVHPSGKIDEPILHPELKLGLEWRFVTFRFQNAKNVVAACLSIIAQLVLRPRDEYEHLKNYCAGLEPRINPLAVSWEEKFGELYKRTDTKRDSTAESEKA